MKYSHLNENTYRILKEAVETTDKAVKEGDLDEALTCSGLAVDILKDHAPTEPSVLQGIGTQYHGPTDTKGARIKAFAFGGSVVITWDDALIIYENHLKAAQALQDKLGWSNRLVGGSSPFGDGYYFVQLSR